MTNISPDNKKPKTQPGNVENDLYDMNETIDVIIRNLTDQKNDTKRLESSVAKHDTKINLNESKTSQVLEAAKVSERSSKRTEQLELRTDHL